MSNERSNQSHGARHIQPSYQNVNYCQTSPIGQEYFTVDGAGIPASQQYRYHGLNAGHSAYLPIYPDGRHTYPNQHVFPPQQSYPSASHAQPLPISNEDLTFIHPLHALHPQLPPAHQAFAPSPIYRSHPQDSLSYGQPYQIRHPAPPAAQNHAPQRGMQDVVERGSLDGTAPTSRLTVTREAAELPHPAPAHRTVDSPQVRAPPSATTTTTTAQPRVLSIAPPIAPPKAPPPAASRLKSPSTPASEHVPIARHVNHNLLLVRLGEDYLAAAYRLGAHAAQSQESGPLVQYQKLIATAVGCFESFLKGIRNGDPALEARVRLRLARILIDETNNDAMIEDVLSKGIAMCERYRLTDQLYSMQYLLVSLTHKTNPRAAQKLTDRMLNIITANDSTHWQFAFRFLKFALALQDDDLQMSQNVIRDAVELAESRQEPAIITLASTLEALVHIQIGSADSVAAAQSALATARSWQLHPSVQNAHEISALVTILDLASDVGVSSQSSKIDAMQDVIDHIDGTSWQQDGAFTVPLGCQCPEIDVNSGGIFQIGSKGECRLSFVWMRRSELYTVAYLLSGIAAFRKDHTDRKAAKYLDEGIKLAMVAERPLNQPLRLFEAYNDRRCASQCNLALCAAVVACCRSKWDLAQTYLQTVQTTEQSTLSSPDHSQFTLYLEALIHHGQGELEKALKLYSSPVLTLTSNTKPSPDLNTNLRILATLNTILVLGTETSTKPRALALLEALEPLAQRCPDPAISAAFYLFRALVSTEPLVRMKSDITRAVSLSKSLNSQQLLTMAVNLLDIRFMVGTVGKQSESAGHAAANLSRTLGSPVLAAAAFGKWGACLELHGKKDKAEGARREAEGYLASVTPGLRENFVVADD